MKSCLAFIYLFMLSIASRTCTIVAFAFLNKISSSSPLRRYNKRCYSSTDEFLKIIPDEITKTQAINLLKQFTDQERKFLESELRVQQKEFERKLLESELERKLLESELKHLQNESELKFQLKDNEITHHRQQALVMKSACTSRGIFEYVLKAVHAELGLVGKFNARQVCDEIIKCK